MKEMSNIGESGIFTLQRSLYFFMTTKQTAITKTCTETTANLLTKVPQVELLSSSPMNFESRTPHLIQTFNKDLTPTITAGKNTNNTGKMALTALPRTPHTPSSSQTHKPPPVNPTTPSYPSSSHPHSSKKSSRETSSLGGNRRPPNWQ